MDQTRRTEVPSLAAMGSTDATVEGLPPGATCHPWNRAFSWALPPVAPQNISGADRDAFDRDGYLVVPDMLDQATVEGLRAELDGLEAEMDELLTSQADGRIYIAEAGAITFTVHAVLRSAAARALAKDRALVGLCHDLLGPDVNLYWDQAVYKKPEKPPPVAPGHRVHVCRAAALPHVLDRAHEHDNDERLPVDPPGCAPRRDPAASLGRSNRLGVPRREPSRSRCRGAGPWRRGRVLVPDAAFHGTEPRRLGGQGLHRAVRPTRHPPNRR